ncbi:MAG: hypothetical protein N2484_06255 [Clostridia bacterium]|nr:hypothetical protein [Clostridia bacterium]
MNSFNEELMDERYPEGYFDHYIAMFQSEMNRSGFKEHADLYIKIEGYSEYKKLVDEIQCIGKNNDWDYFVYLAKELGKDNLDYTHIKELGEVAIEVCNEYNG